MSETSIEWTDRSINPIRARNRETGAVGHFCEKISPGCGHCYAAAWNSRTRRTVGEHGIGTSLDFLPSNRDKVETFLDPEKLQEVLRRRKPAKWFWCDMTDLFGDWVADEWIDQCFAVMALTPQHTHQVLTKRAERMAEYVRTPLRLEHIYDHWYSFDGGPREAQGWPLPNVWLGVSVEDQQRADERIPHLLRTPAAVRFLSCEPLLGPIEFSDVTRRSDAVAMLGKKALTGIHWVICGGESGPKARPMHPDWVRSIGYQCLGASVPFFFKQWGEFVPYDNRLHGLMSNPDDTSIDGKPIVRLQGAVESTRLIEGGILRTAPAETLMIRVGKKVAGRLLDGREWNEFPTV